LVDIIIVPKKPITRKESMMLLINAFGVLAGFSPDSCQLLSVEGSDTERIARMPQ